MPIIVVERSVAMCAQNALKYGMDGSMEAEISSSYGDEIGCAG
ncbi:hypothetical protein [[Clostridium] innocuum]|nr:hypothetical protein [[Clostridium] innocuum]